MTEDTLKYLWPKNIFLIKAFSGYNWAFNFFHSLTPPSPICMLLSDNSFCHLKYSLRFSDNGAITYTWLHAGLPDGVPSASVAPTRQNWNSAEPAACRSHKRRKGCMAALTLSFLNSSYSGLSVGNSRRQSGQEFVCETFCVKISRHKLHLKTPDFTFPSQGKIHPEWKRCLQGISRTVSCSSNSSKHTGHLRPLSVQTQHKTEETCPKIFKHTMLFRNEMWFLITVIGCHLLALEKWRPHWAFELQLLPPEEEGAGPSPTGQRSLRPRGPSAASETYRHGELHDPSRTISTSIWWVLLTWPVLGVRSAGTVHQGWWAHSYVHQNRKPSSQKYVLKTASSLYQQPCTPLDENSQSCVNVKHTGGKKYKSICYSGVDLIIFRHEGNELSFLRQSILRFILPVRYSFCRVEGKSKYSYENF